MSTGLLQVMDLPQVCTRPVADYRPVSICFPTTVTCLVSMQQVLFRPDSTGFISTRPNT